MYDLTGLVSFLKLSSTQFKEICNARPPYERMELKMYCSVIKD